MNVKLLIFLMLTIISIMILIVYDLIMNKQKMNLTSKLLNLNVLSLINQNWPIKNITSTTIKPKIRTIHSAKNYRPDIAVDSNGTWPYISGPNFILISDYVYDFKVNNIEPVERIKNGEIVYVKTDFIGQFFSNIFPKIKSKFILITHNSDYSTNTGHRHYLDEEKLIAWFGVHTSFEHPKFLPLTIGFGNAVYADQLKFIREFDHNSLIKWSQRKYLLYINFNANNNMSKRNHLFSLFKDIPDVLIIDHKTDYLTFMNNIGNSKFTLCPVGNGLDTHRFTEAIFMGSIPILEKSLLMPIYKETTSIVLNDLRDLNITMLRNPQQYATNMNFSRKILMMQTWLDKIDTFRNKID